MSKNNKKKKKKIAVLPLIFAVLSGVLAGFMYRATYVLDIPSGYRFIIIFASVLIGIPIVTIIHEGGHLLFGLLTGYKFSSFRIMSFMWVKENEKIKFRRHKIVGTGGQCLMAPPPLKDGKMPIVLYNFGGAILNAITALVCFILFFIYPNPLFVAPAVLSLFYALQNGVPIHTDMIDNDGYNALSLGKNPEAMRAFWTQLSVMEMQTREVRLCDMPAEWFYMPSDDAVRNSLVATNGVFYCNRLMDEGRFDEADEAMAHLLAIESGVVGLHRNLLLCDRIFCELIGEGRLNVVDGYMSTELKNFMLSMKSFPSVIRTEYVYALLYERNEDKANRALERFVKVGEKYPYKSDLDSERELMDIALKKYKETLTI